MLNGHWWDDIVKRLLCIVGGMNAGGAETFLMKIYRGLDKSKYQMDFAIAEKGVYDKEIKSLGGRIFRITPKSKGALKNFNDIKDIVKKYHYNSVLRVSQNSLSALELLAAKLGGAKIRAYRSSNSSTVNGSKKEEIVHRACMWMPKAFANVRFAPSTEAAEFMFGKGCIQKGEAFIINNGLDLDVYKYSDEARRKIRAELGVNDELVVGHVGRFNQQKNHKFLIQVFAEIKKIIPDAVLILCGKGEKQKEVENQVMNLGLQDSVKFLGVRSDIPDVLSAMDVFVFPSLYEGMPNTVIEAQATGLPCLIADTITKEAKVTNLVHYEPLDDPIKWAQKTIDIYVKADFERLNFNRKMREEHYGISDCIEDFCSHLF